MRDDSYGLFGSPAAAAGAAAGRRHLRSRSSLATAQHSRKVAEVTRMLSDPSEKYSAAGGGLHNVIKSMDRGEVVAVLRYFDKNLDKECYMSTAVLREKLIAFARTKG